MQVTLARDGKPAATVVIARQPTRAAQFAAYELRRHLQQITVADFPIVHDDEPIRGLAVLVGDSKQVRAMGIKPARLQKQEYLIRLTPEALVLVGRDKDDRGVVQYDPTPNQQTLDTWPGIWDEQGTMYAVYDFLERYCDVRWFTPTEFGTDCPRQATLTVTGVDLQRAPFMKYRYAAYPSSENYDQYTGLWPTGSEGQKKWEAAAYPNCTNVSTEAAMPSPNAAGTRSSGYGTAKAAKCARQPLAVRLLPPVLGGGEGAGATVRGPARRLVRPGIRRPAAADVLHQPLGWSNRSRRMPASSSRPARTILGHRLAATVSASSRWTTPNSASAPVARNGSPAAMPTARSLPTAATAITSSSSSTKSPSSSARSTPTNTSSAWRT